MEEVKQSTKKTPTGKKRSRSRNWAFTDFLCRDLKSVYVEYSDIIRYIAWGDEIGEESKKRHWQGWVQFTSQKDQSVVQRIMGSGVHLTKCLGTEIQNEDYCKKDDKFTSMGAYITQGQRTDFEQIKKRLDKEEPMYDIAQDHFSDYLRYHQGFTKYQELVSQSKSKTFRHVTTDLYKGPTGSGKTRKAMEEEPFKIHASALKWWDGYQGEKTLLIDEYDNQIPCTELLGILDGYQLRLAIKGGFTYARWTKVIITTNLEDLHQNAKIEHQLALTRRITNIETFECPEVTEG